MTTDWARTIIICAGGWVLERKLIAILCADVFGYSRLMGDDEEATLRTLSSHRKLIDSLIERHHGRFVNSAGDDSVVIDLEGKPKAYKVLTRHFYYTHDFCTVIVAVTDLDPKELADRIKE